MSVKENVCRCSYCSKLINKDDDKWLRDNTKNYHYDCYIEKMNSKKGSLFELVKLEADKLLKENVERITLAKTKDSFYKYIQVRYGITFIPTYIFTKMSAIFNGEYKGQLEPVEVEDLLEMFKKKEKELDKIYSNNLTKGKSLDNIGRFNYDLAIMLNNYDSYKAWKEKNKHIGLNESGNEKVNEKLKRADFISDMYKKIEEETNRREIDIQKYIDEI